MKDFHKKHLKKLDRLQQKRKAKMSEEVKEPEIDDTVEKETGTILKEEHLDKITVTDPLKKEKKQKKRKLKETDEQESEKDSLKKI